MAKVSPSQSQNSKIGPHKVRIMDELKSKSFNGMKSSPRGRDHTNSKKI